MEKKLRKWAKENEKEWKKLRKYAKENEKV